MRRPVFKFILNSAYSWNFVGNVSDTAQVDAIGYLLLELKYSVADGNPSGGMLEPPVKKHKHFFKGGLVF